MLHLRYPLYTPVLEIPRQRFSSMEIVFTKVEAQLLYPLLNLKSFNNNHTSECFFCQTLKTLLLRDQSFFLISLSKTDSVLLKVLFMSK